MIRDKQSKKALKGHSLSAFLLFVAFVAFCFLLFCCLFVFNHQKQDI
jgi:hypothetical protein